MSDQGVKRDLTLLVGYLLTSAHGLYGEPPDYGPFRLLDAAGRLLHLMRAHGLWDPEMDAWVEVIDRERFGNSTDEELRAVLDDLILAWVDAVKSSTSGQGETR